MGRVFLGQGEGGQEEQVAGLGDAQKAGAEGGGRARGRGSWLLQLSMQS